LEPEVTQYKRGQEILLKYPDARLIEVASHWKIPELHGFHGSVEDWIKIKRHVLVLSIKKSLAVRPNTRSANFIAPFESMAAQCRALIVMCRGVKAMPTHHIICKY